jgi:hypothetical protein
VLLGVGERVELDAGVRVGESESLECGKDVAACRAAGAPFGQLDSRIRLISHRAHGFHSAEALIAMAYLCCAGIHIDLPHR